jgi:hypothetical protein
MPMSPTVRHWPMAWSMEGSSFCLSLAAVAGVGGRLAGRLRACAPATCTGVAVPPLLAICCGSGISARAVIVALGMRWPLGLAALQSFLW